MLTIPLKFVNFTINDLPPSKLDILHQHFVTLPINAIIYGVPGKGKTGFTIALLKYYLERKVSGNYIRYSELLDKLKNNTQLDDGFLSAKTNYRAYSILCIDNCYDLNFNPLVAELITIRHEDLKSTIICLETDKTDLDFEDISDIKLRYLFKDNFRQFHFCT